MNVVLLGTLFVKDVYINSFGMLTELYLTTDISMAKRFPIQHALDVELFLKSRECYPVLIENIDHLKKQQ